MQTFSEAWKADVIFVLSFYHTPAFFPGELPHVSGAIVLVAAAQRTPLDYLALVVNGGLHSWVL